jgi:hypothetical protein
MNIMNLAASAERPAELQKVSLMLGDEVFITGAFWPRLGEQKNIPIVRMGNIAALPEEPVEFFSPRHPAYLVETRSLGGISGSPVFFDPHTRSGTGGRSLGPVAAANAGTGKSSRPTIIIPHRFVGMVLGTWHSDSEKDFISGQIGDKRVDALWNTGISVVLPDSRIVEFLMSENMQRRRQEAIADREKRSGYYPTSARGAKPEPPTTADNPSHQKD